jgi:predicted transcriptional regulator
MAIHLTAEQESQLGQIAQSHGITADEVVQDVIRHYLEQEAADEAATNEALAEIERGETVEHSEMVAWTKSYLGT